MYSKLFKNFTIFHFIIKYFCSTNLVKFWILNLVEYCFYQKNRIFSISIFKCDALGWCCGLWSVFDERAFSRRRSDEISCEEKKNNKRKIHDSLITVKSLFLFLLRVKGLFWMVTDTNNLLNWVRLSADVSIQWYCKLFNK